MIHSIGECEQKIVELHTIRAWIISFIDTELDYYHNLIDTLDACQSYMHGRRLGKNEEENESEKR